MGVSRELDNRIRRLNKRVDDAIKMTGQTGQYAKRIQVLMQDVALELARETARPMSDFVVYKPNADGVERMQLRRTNSLNKLTRKKLDSIISKLEKVGTAGKSKQVKEIKQKLKEQGVELTHENITAEADKQHNREEEVTRAFEYIYAMSQMGDKEAERLLASMYGTHGTAEQNADRALKFYEKTLQKNGSLSYDPDKMKHMRRDTESKAQPLIDEVIKWVYAKDYDEALRAANNLIKVRFSRVTDKGERTNTSDLPNARQLLANIIDDIANGYRGDNRGLYRLTADKRIEKYDERTGVWF